MKKNPYVVMAVSVLVGIFLVFVMVLIWLNSLAKVDHYTNPQHADCQGWYQCAWFNHRTPEFIRRIILNNTGYFGLGSLSTGAANDLQYVDPKRLGSNVWTVLDNKLLDELDSSCGLTNESVYVTSKGMGYVLTFDEDGMYGSDSRVRVCDVVNKKQLTIQYPQNIQKDSFEVLSSHNGLTLAVVNSQGDFLGLTKLERSKTIEDDNKCVVKISDLYPGKDFTVPKLNQYQSSCALSEMLSAADFPDLKLSALNVEKLMTVAKFIDVSRMQEPDIELLKSLSEYGELGKYVISRTVTDKYTFNNKIEDLSGVRTFSQATDDWRTHISKLKAYINLPVEYDLLHINEVMIALDKSESNTYLPYNMDSIKELAKSVRRYDFVVMNQEPKLDVYRGGSFAYYGLLAYTSPPKPVVIVSDKILYNSRGYASITGYEIGKTVITHDGFDRNAVIIRPLSDEEDKRLVAFNNYKREESRVVANSNDIQNWIKSINNQIDQSNQPVLLSK